MEGSFVKGFWDKRYSCVVFNCDWFRFKFKWQYFGDFADWLNAMTALMRRENPTSDLYQEYIFYWEESYSLHPFFQRRPKFWAEQMWCHLSENRRILLGVKNSQDTLLHAIVSSTSLCSKVSLIKRCFMIKNLMLENFSYFLKRVSFIYFFIP